MSREAEESLIPFGTVERLLLEQIEYWQALERELKQPDGNKNSINKRLAQASASAVEAALFSIREEMESIGHDTRQGTEAEETGSGIVAP